MNAPVSNRGGGPRASRATSALLVLLLFGQLMLMAASVRGGDGATLLQSATLRATSPIADLSSSIGRRIRGAFASVREVGVARRENVLLREDIRRLRSENATLRERAEQNRRLRALLEMRGTIEPSGTVAPVIAASFSGGSDVLVLSAGTDDGVRRDAAVVAWGGAVGRVVYADESFSKVHLLTHAESSVGGILQSSRAPGSVWGQGERALLMKYVSKDHDVRLGERVVTSAMDRVFPPGYTIGRVAYVGEAEGVSHTIRLQPAVDFARLEEVLVLDGRWQDAALEPDEGEPAS